MNITVKICFVLAAILLIWFIMWARKEAQKINEKPHKRSKEEKLMMKLRRAR